MLKFLYVIRHTLHCNTTYYTVFFYRNGEILMNDEVKVRSFRISDSVAEKFKAFCGEFDSQNAALDSLITTYEMQNAKSVLVDRKTEIAEFDTNIQAIQSAFLRSLELNENAEQRVKTELSSKDETIMQLQAEKAKAMEQTEQYKTSYDKVVQDTDKQLKAMQEKVSENSQALQNEKERADTEQKAREQAETISAMLSGQIKELQEQLAQLKAQNAELSNRAEQAETTSSKLSDELMKLKSAYSEVQRTLVDEQASRTKELAAADRERETAVKYAIADTAGKYQRKIDEMQLKIDDMQTKQAEQLAMLFSNQNKQNNN